MGSLHNYRLFLLRHGMTEDTPTGSPRLTLFAHGIAGVLAGWTRYEIPRCHNYFCIKKILSALVATPVELLKGSSTLS